jgi:hypothetical protein
MWAIDEGKQQKQGNDDKWIESMKQIWKKALHVIVTYG